jgi:thioester reductase-like protein
MSCTPEQDSLVAESAEFRENAEHLVEYTFSKSTIEQLMRQECPNLPLLIARPSIVVGHTRHGCTPSSSIFWVFSMGLMLQKFMCSMEDRIDVVPVDYCADALLMLLNSNARPGKWYTFLPEKRTAFALRISIRRWRRRWRKPRRG